jgi:endonuclease/exonuclease/phosphatase family metal-dependent hydrolase
MTEEASIPHGGQKLRVVTWNIHKGIGGVDRLYRPNRVVKVLRRCAADIVFLQEVDEGVPRSSMDRQVDLLGDALGYPFRAYFPNVRLKRGHYGNALLSRFPIDHQENIDLTRPLRKRRGALHARRTGQLAGAARRLWLYNVHLGLAESERRKQLRFLIDWHEGHRVPHDTLVVLGGDFNDVFGRLDRVVMNGHGFRGTPVRRATFPAARPLRPLDTFFVKGPVHILRCRRAATGVAREASDHLAVCAVLEPRAPDGAPAAGDPGAAS